MNTIKMLIFAVLAVVLVTPAMAAPNGPVKRDDGYYYKQVATPGKLVYRCVPNEYGGTDCYELNFHWERVTPVGHEYGKPLYCEDIKSPFHKWYSTCNCGSAGCYVKGKFRSLEEVQDIWTKENQ